MTGHETVLRQEAVDALVKDVNGTYVDCTYGRGGHTSMILDRLSNQGRVLGIDKDLAAVEHARTLIASDPRLKMFHGSFASIQKFLIEAELKSVDGILIDLGVSSPQLDEAERGFSFNTNGPLDMRMDQTAGITAADWLNTAKVADIAYVIRRYGEEKFARRIASRIVAAREIEPLTTTRQLVEIIEAAVPTREQKKHPATRTFQAIRIYVNNELQDLEDFLEVVLACLAPGGRLVVISFHSLEDRIVKRFMRNQARGEQLPSRLPIRDAEIVRHLKLIGKPVKPSEEEVSRNRRARSSIMRVAEKVA